MSPHCNAVSLVVTEMAKTVDFYRRCGLELPADGIDSHLEAVTAGGFKIMFDTVEVVRSFRPDWRPPSGGHAMALAFECSEPSEVDRIHRDLVGAGYASLLEPFDAFWGQRYAQVADPDHNPVDLYASA